jgi:hypothetical protein
MGFELMYEYVVWLAIGLTVGCRERHYENYLLADWHMQDSYNKLVILLQLHSFFIIKFN